MVCSRHFDVSCPCDTTTGFFLGGVFLSRRHGPLHALGVRTPLLSSVVITPHHRCLEADMAWDPLASVGHADIFLDLARGTDCTSRTSHCRFSEGRSRCSRHISCQRKWQTDFKLLSRSDCLFSSSHWSLGNGAHLQSRVLVGLNYRRALSILDAIFKFARASIRLQESLSLMCVRKKEHLEEFFFFFAVICIFFGLMSASVDASCASCSRFRQGVASWFRRSVGSHSEDKVQEMLQVHPCTVACVSFHRSGCRFAGLFLRWLPSELNYSEKGSRFSTAIMTRTNYIFTFWRSASYDLHWHGHATKTPFSLVDRPGYW